MGDDYKPAELLPGSTNDVEKPIREVCYALISDKNEIIHIFSPGTMTPKVKDGARVLETGYGLVICDVTFDVQPYYKIYRPLSEVTTSSNSQQSKVFSSDFSKYKEMEIAPLADRKFEAHNYTNFLGIKVGNTIQKVFPRGTSVQQISNFAFLLEGDIVLVKARANYKITGLAKIEKTNEQMRQN